MTDRQLSYNRVIKAMECCIKYDCKPCSLLKYSDDVDVCQTQLIKIALDLINRQKEEIERLTAMVEAAEDYLHPLPFINAFDDQLAKSKSEAIKEFAERLLSCYKDFDETNEIIYFENLTKAIQDTLKEMVGDSNA